MLVMTRRPGEIIDIGGGIIQVYVDKIVGSRVWIGITAPKEMRIDRREVTIQRMMADGIPLNEIEQQLDAADVQP